MKSPTSFVDRRAPDRTGVAQVVVWEAGQARRPVPLDAQVVRVGSHPACGLRLEGVEPHALTIEQRQGRARVYNRTGRGLGLGVGEIAPGGAAAWEPGDRLALAGGLELELRLGPAALPAPEAVNRSVVIEDTTTTGEPQDTPRGSSTTSWAAVVLLTLVAVAVWIASHSLTHPEVGPALADELTRPDTLTDLVTELQQQGDEGRYIAHEIQVAAQDEERDCGDAALSRRLRLRDRLFRERPRDGHFASRDQALEQALQYLTKPAD